MLPAPPSSCAGWWLAQLWQALLAERPPEHASWRIEYPGLDTLRLRPAAWQGVGLEQIQGSLRRDGQDRCSVSREWPGDEGMLHAVHASWQLGETIVRPLEWHRARRPPPAEQGGGTPWPLRVRIQAHGWHAQLLDRIDLVASDGDVHYPLLWEPPQGTPRVPHTELPCALTTLQRRDAGDLPALVLAGLTLPWRIDIDHDAWPIWRRLGGAELLRALGGPAGTCPRHGSRCPWPATGNGPDDERPGTWYT